MSSLPARMAKRAMKKRGCVRQWEENGYGKVFPTYLTDSVGNYVGETWTQAAAKVGRV